MAAGAAAWAAALGASPSLSASSPVAPSPSASAACLGLLADELGLLLDLVLLLDLQPRRSEGRDDRLLEVVEQRDAGGRA